MSASYLGKAGALLDKPLDRLSKMNPLSIELYKRYKYDITRDPLEFAVNNQHMNGGLAVDAWGATNVAGCYAIGEAAGTHGVTRPGGAALNAGQVFGTRSAEHIAARGVSRSAPGSEAKLVDDAVGRALDVLKPDSGLSIGAVRKEVQARMSDHAGILCNASDVTFGSRRRAGAERARSDSGALLMTAPPAPCARCNGSRPHCSPKPYSRRWRSTSSIAAAAAAPGRSALPTEIARLKRAWGRLQISASFPSGRKTAPNRYISACRMEYLIAVRGRCAAAMTATRPSSSATGPISSPARSTMGPADS